MANVAANIAAAQNKTHMYSRARFVAGAWASMPAWLTEQGLVNAFDVILTAETVYDLGNVPSLMQSIAKV